MRGARASFFMRYRKLDEDGDYRFGAGPADFHINSPDVVAQAVETRLKLWIGEWFANTGDGTGWNEAILGKHSKNLYELTLRQRVLETPGVVSIDTFASQFNPNDRRLTVAMTINTVYGQAYLDRSLNT